MVIPTNDFNIAALNGADADQARLDAVFQARLVWSVIEHGTQLSRTHPDQSFQTLMRHLVATMTPPAIS